MDIRAYNREAWNKQVADGDRWTQPSPPELIARAKKGDVEIVLTPTKRVPASWLGELHNKHVLCLASGGGQQGPLLAAAGAIVTVFDNSPAQLEQDRRCAEREGLTLSTVEGDMRDLSAFPDASFDLIVHPVSNCFSEVVRPVWLECARVLRIGGELIAGFNNPVSYVFDQGLKEQGILQVKNKLPYSDHTNEDARKYFTERKMPLEFSHTLEDQIGGQIDAGLALVGFFEDVSPTDPTAFYFPPFIATRARRLV